MRGDDIGTSNVPVANALRALLAQPADQQGEPDIVIDLVQPNPYSDGLHIRIWHNTGMLGPGEYKLYLHVQPATAKVVLPERRPICCHEDAGFNECLDEVAKLNGGQT
ncbi:hypothetical protein ALP12_200172 [Pseudomonas savastanoi pv. phaseolicola]|nr:hypothetical protein ALP12_200172 [Pseudomonas savastanoi pv. phaseolicola]